MDIGILIGIGIILIILVLHFTSKKKEAPIIKVDGPKNFYAELEKINENLGAATAKLQGAKEDALKSIDNLEITNKNLKIINESVKRVI